MLTPTNAQVPFDTATLRENGDHDQGMQVESLHEDPHVAGHQHVIEHGEQHFTLPMLQKNFVLTITG